MLALLYFLVCARDPQAAQGPAVSAAWPVDGRFGPAVVETRRSAAAVRDLGRMGRHARGARPGRPLRQDPGADLQVLVDTGDRVKHGQVLARIDAAEQREQIDQLAAAVEMARATLAQRRAALEIAGGNAARTQSLFEQQLVALQQQEAAQAELRGPRRRCRWRAPPSSRRRPTSRPAASSSRRRCIVAPFSGSVGKRHLDLGAFAAGNQPVFTLIDVSTIETTLPLSEKDAARVRVGQPAVVTVEALRGAEFQGRVARIASLFDPRTNTAEAEVEIANSDGRLKPGMFASVAVALRPPPTPSSCRARRWSRRSGRPTSSPSSARRRGPKAPAAARAGGRAARRAQRRQRRRQRRGRAPAARAGPPSACRSRSSAPAAAAGGRWRRSKARSGRASRSSPWPAGAARRLAGRARRARRPAPAGGAAKPAAPAARRASAMSMISGAVHRPVTTIMGTLIVVLLGTVAALSCRWTSCPR